jgi:hypothetical protein
MGHVLNSEATNVTISNTAAESTMYAYTMPANTLAMAGSIVRTRQVATLNNASGATRTYTLRMKLGATTVISDGLPVPDGGGTRAFIIDTETRYDAASNAQVNTMTITPTASDTAATGTGSFSAAGIGPSLVVASTSAVDMTAAVAIAVTVQSDAATATQTIVVVHASCEVA